MKKIGCAALSLLLFLLGGCSTGMDRESFSIRNTHYGIYDADEHKIGEIDSYGILIQTDDSIIYNHLPQATSQEITDMDYYRYDFATNRSVKIGTIENWVYESKYNTTVIGNTLYMFITTQEEDQKESTLHLYKIDLESNDMSVVFSEKGAFQYNAMTSFGDTLYIVQILDNGCDMIAYDTVSGARDILKRFDFDDAAGTGETIRQITSDDDTLVWLRLKIDEEQHTALYLDRYTADMTLIESADLSSITSERTDLDKTDWENERRQGVSTFWVRDNLFYYENFSITRLLGKIENGSITSMTETALPGTWGAAYEAVQNSDSIIFYEAFAKDNKIYWLDGDTGNLREASFKVADDERYAIHNLSRDTRGNLLIYMGYEDPDTGETLEPRLYYVPLEELDFS
ncbi:MAG: hypothetical protein ACLUUJ_02090 [Acutalibacteraceae bacterium]